MKGAGCLRSETRPQSGLESARHYPRKLRGGGQSREATFNGNTHTEGTRRVGFWGSVWGRAGQAETTQTDRAAR